MVLCVDLLDVLHERGKGTRIGLLSGWDGGAQEFDFPALNYHTRETLRILLYPDGGITRHAVLPAGEPQKYDALVGFTCLSKQAVNEREIVFAFDGLDEFPA